MKRRQFLQSSSVYLSGAGVASMLPGDLLAFKKRIAASDKIRIGAIGINGMGWSDLTSVLKDPRAQCIALCDVDKKVLDNRAAELAKKTNHGKHCE
jgi:hypothetical protein